MKYFNIAILISIMFFSCKQEKNKLVKDKTHISVKSDTNNIHKTVIAKEVQTQSNLKQELKNPKFYREEIVNVYSFKAYPVKQDYILISAPSMRDSLGIEHFFVEDNFAQDFYSNTNTDTAFCYSFVNYSLIFETEKIRAFTVFCNYDYSKKIILITSDRIDNSLIGSELIAMVLGDAGETTEIHSTRIKNTFFRTTQEKELKDGVYVIKKTVKDSIRIENDGQITLLH